MRNRVELLLLVLMLAVVGGLACCAIARVRDAAGRAGCASNLKLLAMGLHNYHDTHGRFPPGTAAETMLPPERRLSWMIDVPAFTEGIGGRLLFDPGQPWDVEPNRVPRIRRKESGSVVPFGFHGGFVCPANPDRDEPPLPHFTHYVGLTGVGADAATLPAGHPRAGLFGYDRVTRISSITDGASETLILAETATDNGPWTAGGYPTIRGLDPDQLPHIGRGAPFSSRHSRSVVMVATADGAVQPLLPTISPRVFEAQVTIRGGEIPLPDW